MYVSRPTDMSLMRLHYGIWNIMSSNLSSSKPTTIQTFNGLGGRLHYVKLNIYFTLIITINRCSETNQSKRTDLGFFLNFDSLDLAVLLFTFTFHVLRQIFVPVSFSLSMVTPDIKLSHCANKKKYNILIWIEHILQQDTSWRLLLSYNRFHTSNVVFNKINKKWTVKLKLTLRAVSREQIQS